ncbi:MAG: type IV pilus secretin PilQ [Pseudomonadota bacterium]
MKPKSSTWSAIVVGAAVLSTGALRAEQAANRVTGVQLQPAGEATRVLIATEAAPRYTVFKLSAPLRVVIDVQGGDVAALGSPLAGQGLVQGVAATQFDDASGKIGRLVVTLRDGARYDVVAEGQTLVLTATPEQSGRQAAATEPPAASRGQTPEQTAAVEAQVPELEPASPPARRLLAIEARPSNHATLLTLRTDGEPLRYEVKEIDNPPRLVVDLYDVSTRLKKSVAIQDANLQRARVGWHQGKTRVVIDTVRGVPIYDVAVAADGLTLAITDRFPERAATNVAPQTATVKDVQVSQMGDFWRIKMTLDGDFEERLASDAPRMKIVELKARLPETLRRTLDASAQNGPVQRVSTFTDPDDPSMVRLAADLRGEVEHKLWHQDNALFWDFRLTANSGKDPVATTAAGHSTQLQGASQAVAPAARRYSGKRITLDVKEADILNVLRLIADVSKLNIIAADTVTGKVTIKLRNVPWDQALDVILKSKGLGMERRGGIIRVAPQTELQAEREMKAKQRELDQKSIPTTVKLLVVNYANAAEMLPQVQKILSIRGTATVDARTNVIIVEDIKENLVQAERLVRTLDTQTPQVLIEARIVEASTSFVRNLGIQWGGGLNFSQANGNPTGLVFPYNFGMVGAADSAQSGTLQGGVFKPSNFAVNYPVAAEGEGSAMGMSFGSIGDAGTLNLRLTAAESEGQAKVVSAPKVVTIDNKTAKISQGVDIPVATISAAGTQTQLITAALELEVTPHVTTDGSVLLKIHVSNNVPNFERTVLGVPAIEKKEADTEVLLYDGDTSVIGGIYTRRTNESHRYTPFIGKIPLLGWLFQSSFKEDERKELLAFITPRIVNRKKALVNVQDNP